MRLAWVWPESDGVYSVRLEQGGCGCEGEGREIYLDRGDREENGVSVERYSRQLSRRSRSEISRMYVGRR